MVEATPVDANTTAKLRARCSGLALLEIAKIGLKGGLVETTLPLGDPMGLSAATIPPAASAPLNEQVEWLGCQRLAFGQEQSELRFDSNDLADEIGLTVNLRRFEARQCRQPFAHLASYLLAGDMAVSAAAYVPLVASTSDYSESAFEIPYYGHTRYRIEGHDWFNRAGQQALYLPGQAFEVETGHFNGLLFNLNPQRLAATIGTESRRQVPLELAERWVQQPAAINLRDPRVIRQQRSLEIGLASLAQHNGEGLGDPFGPLALGVESLLYQCSARMLLIAMG